jgi:signal transduction histidine kinase
MNLDGHLNLVRGSLRLLVDRRQWRIRAYLLLGLPFGVLWFALVAVLYLSGLAAQFLPIGVVFMIGAQLLLRPIGRFERFLVGRLLGEPVAAPQPLRYRRPIDGRWAWWRGVARRAAAAFRDGHSWRVLAWTLLRFVIGPLGFVLVTVEILLPPALVAVALAPAVAGVTGRLPAHVRWTYLLLLAPAALPLLVPLQASIWWLSRALQQGAEWALGPGRHELEAAALARAEAAEEQVRIDQELHDSIGHLLSMIVVQAGAGAHVFDTDPAFARSALHTIEERGRAALGELDRIIAAFRTDPQIAVAGVAAQAPLRGGEDLPGLLAGAADAGLELTSRLRTGDLPAPVGRGVYRIVQEALTNAAKHAPASPVTVDVAADLGVVAISVANSAPPARPPTPSARRTEPPARPPTPPARRPEPRGRSGPDRTGGGRGLASIRDRAGLLGGVATTGVTDDGGFAVRVVLPLHDALPDGATARCTLGSACSCLGCGIRRSVFR